MSSEELAETTATAKALSKYRLELMRVINGTSDEMPTAPNYTTN